MHFKMDKTGNLCCHSELVIFLKINNAFWLLQSHFTQLTLNRFYQLFFSFSAKQWLSQFPVIAKWKIAATSMQLLFRLSCITVTLAFGFGFACIPAHVANYLNGVVINSTEAFPVSSPEVPCSLLPLFVIIWQRPPHLHYLMHVITWIRLPACLHGPCGLKCLAKTKFPLAYKALMRQQG